MKKIFAIILIAFLPSITTYADEPIKSIDSFEADMKKCLLKNSDPAKCLGNTMRGHFSPGNENLNEVVTQLASVLKQWLAGNKVYAMHPVKNKKLAKFYDERVYLIEDSDGNVIMLETAFVNTLGKWYLHRFNLSSKKDVMSSVLGVNL